jgi:CspA family cold shock protein
MTNQGKVNFYNHVKGYGFISRDNDQADLFVHVSEFRKNGIKKVVEGMIVSYDIINYNGKEVATNIQLINSPK